MTGRSYIILITSFRPELIGGGISVDELVPAGRRSDVGGKLSQTIEYEARSQN